MITEELQEQLTDLGEEYPKLSCGCDDCRDKDKDEEKKKKHYPRETFTTDQMPSLAGLTVGDKVCLIIEAEVCATSKGEEYFDDDSEDVKTRITVKLMEGVAKKLGKKNMAEEEKDVEDMGKSKSNDYMSRLMSDDNDADY